MSKPFFKAKDNAEGELLASISAAALSIPLKAGNGALFPQPYKGSATSLGSKVLLNSTGIGATGIVAGDYIENVTDGSSAFVLSVSTNSLTTTPLRGGSDNTWQSADVYGVNRFILTLNSRDVDGNITDYEQVLIENRSTDTLTVATGGRGYNGTTADTWSADDFASLFVTESIVEGIRDFLRMLDINKLSSDGLTGLLNNTALTGRNVAGTANIDMLKVDSGDVVRFSSLPRNPTTRTIADDYDIIDKKYFADNTTISGAKSFTLKENLTAGDLVKIVNDGGVAKIESLEAGALGSPTVYDATAVLLPCACQIDDNKIAIAWKNASSQIRVIVGTISGTTITFGSAATASPASNGNALDICQIDTDKFVVAFADSTDTDGTAVACTVSGTTITVGAEADFDASAAPVALGIDQLATDKFVIGYQQGATNDAEAVVATVSGTTITFGTPVLMLANSPVKTRNSVAKVDTDKFVMVANDTTNVAKIFLCTVSVRTITLVDTFSFNESIIQGGVGICPLDTNLAIISFDLTNTSNNLMQVGLLRVNGDVVSIDVQDAIGETDNSANLTNIKNLGGGAFIVACVTATNRAYVIKGYVRDGIIRFYPQIEIEGTDLIGDMALTKSSNRGDYVAVIDNNSSNNGEAFALTARDHEKCAGVLKETGTAGQEKSVTIFGGVNSNQTFSAADFGKNVYIQPNATVGTTVTNFRIGRILSATEMTFEL